MMSISNALKWLTRPSTATSPTRYTDGTAERLRVLRLEQKDVTRRLAVAESEWTALEPRRDADAHLERSRLAPQIRDLRARVAELAAEIVKVEEDARLTTAKAIEYERLVGEARRLLDPILDRLVNAEELTRARELSRRIASEASELHRRTNERRYRRPVDPLGEVFDALRVRIAGIERARWTGGSAPVTLRLDKTV